MLKPKDNTKLFGYKDVETKILKEFENDKLHHSLLITGNKGIGKATFVYRLANKILSGEQSVTTGLFGEAIVENEELDKNNPTFMKIKAGSHPDLMSVEIKIDEKTKKPKSSITVDSIREIREFLNLTPALSQYRIVIIDSADEMNVGASNAILKILEEPPKNSFLFLVSHNPGKLLDTIRSRCREVKMSPLLYENWKNAIENAVSDNPLYNIQEEDFAILSEISDNSVHTALELSRHNGMELYKDFVNLMFNSDVKELTAFSVKISAKDFPFWLFEYILNIFFTRAIRLKSVGKLNNFFSEDEEIALIKFARSNSVEELFEKYSKVKEDLSNTIRLNLSKKNVTTVILNDLSS